MKFSFSISFFVLAMILFWACSDNNDLPEPDDNNNGISPDEFAMGVDLSYVNQVEDNGGVYRESGTEVDPYQVLQKYGANTVRLRLWHNPDWVHELYDGSSPLYSGYEDVEKSIARAKQAGMGVMLNFHYSDIWADPGHQQPPSAWRDITDIDVLADSVYHYTYNVLSKLLSKGLLPEMVQIGNETNCGMMMTNTPEGFPGLNVCQGQWQNFGMVVNAAIKAVRQVDELAGQNTVIALHVADPNNMEWWLRDVLNIAGVSDFQVMGFSYYHIWHNTVEFNDLSELVSRIKNTYNRDIMLLETAYPFTTANNDNYPNIYYNQPQLPGFPYSVEGQRDFMITLTQNLMDAGARGAFYWEPAWITSNMVDLWGVGSSWENCAFFNFSGNITDVVQYLNFDYHR